MLAIPAEKLVQMNVAHLMGVARAQSALRGVVALDGCR
jgi:hypothetical protein